MGYISGRLMKSCTGNILALMPDAFGGYGGIAQYNRDLLSALALHTRIRRVDVLVRTGEAQAQQTPEKIMQHAPYEAKGTYSLAALRTAILRKDVGTIFCGHVNMAPLAFALARLSGARLWIQVHGVDAWYPLPALVRRAVEQASLVTSVSRFTRDKLLGNTSLEPFRVKVLPNTFRSVFSPGSPSTELLERLGLTNCNVLLTVSRLSREDAYKGHARVLNAMPAVLRAVPNAVYVIVGDGNGRADLEALVDRMGLRSNVRFLGRLDDESLVALYRSSQLFVMPSTKEGFGIVFVEAARCGIPVIGGNKDGTIDALADGVIGTLIDPTSESELADAICNMLAMRPPSTTTQAERFSFKHFSTHAHVLYEQHFLLH